MSEPESPYRERAVIEPESPQGEREASRAGRLALAPAGLPEERTQ